MKQRVLTLTLTLLLLLVSGRYVLAEDSTIENKFDLALVSGPDGGEIKADDNTVKFSAAGDYVLRLVPDEADLAAMLDEQIALTVQPAAQVQASATDKDVKVKFSIEFVSGPSGSTVDVKGNEVTFSTAGQYTLRLTPDNTALVSMTDDTVEIDVKSTEQVETAFDAMAAALPDTPVDIQQVVIKPLFLPMITAEQHTHQNADQMHAAALAAIDASFADEFGPFDKNRIPIELQAWWTPAFGHIHVAVLAPLGQAVSGVIKLPVRIVMHENPSVLKQLRIDSDEGVEMKIPLGNLVCKDVICAWSLTVSLDTTKLSGGWRELRFRGETTAPDGRKYLNSSGVPVLVQNGGGAKNYNRFCNNTSLIGRGWYDGFGYTNAIVECVPTAPVKGTVTFRVKAQHPSASLTVDIDRAHIIPAVPGWPYQPALTGTNLLTVNGNQSSWASVTLDTTKLSNGWHNFFVRSDGPNGMVSQCSGCPNVKSHPAGIAKFWFYVSN